MTGRPDTFSKAWPHIVNARGDVKFDDIFAWVYDRADALDMDARDLYTSFSLTQYGFKDPKLAMEFKLVFG